MTDEAEVSAFDEMTPDEMAEHWGLMCRVDERMANPGRQAMFARQYVETLNPTLAFRVAFDAGDLCEEAIGWRVDHVLSLPLVVACLGNGLGAPVTLDGILSELEAARVKALSEPNGAAVALQATATRAHLAGFYNGMPRQRDEEADDPARRLH